MRIALLVAALLVARSAATPAAEPTRLEARWAHAMPAVLPQALVPDTTHPRIVHAALKNGGVAVLETPEAGGEVRELARVPTARLAGLDAMNLALEGSTLYVALGDFFRAQGAPAGLAVVDVRDPARPRVRAVWRSPEPMNGAAAVAVTDGHAFLGAMHHGVMVFDVRDPERIALLATFRPDPDFPRPNPGRLARPNARGLAVAGNRLFVAYDAGGLRVLDIADPASPREIGRYINRAIGRKQQAYNNVAIDRTRAYVAVDYAGMEVLDVADPARIRALAWWNPWDAHTPRNVWFNSPGHTNQIAYDAASRRVYLSAGDSELVVVDVADPARPTWVAVHGQPKNGRGTWGVALGPDVVLLTYIRTWIPFRGGWSGIVAVPR